jgi:aspartate/methionine/tyrosine aminotransferase
MNLPREFFIEDRLEKYRSTAFCNLGESGLRNFTLREIIQMNNIDLEEILDLSLKDSPNNGRLDLRTAISSLYLQGNSDEILVTTGTSESLYLFFQYFIKKGIRFGYLAPAFQALYEIPIFLGGIPKPIEYKNSTSYKELFQNTDLVILNHPHNPTGISPNKEEWEIILNEVNNFSGIVLFDEHYRFLDYNNSLGVSGAFKNTNCYATGSITKSFGVTGLRIGWITGNKLVLNQIRSFKDYLTHTVNPISEFLALKIILNKDQILPTLKKRVLENLESFKNFATSINSIVDPKLPKGGLVFFPKLKNGLNSEIYADELYKNCGVFVLPGSNFEKEGYIRVGLGEEPKIFLEGMKRWAKWESIN